MPLNRVPTRPGQNLPRAAVTLFEPSKERFVSTVLDLIEIGGRQPIPPDLGGALDMPPVRPEILERHDACPMR